MSGSSETSSLVAKLAGVIEEAVMTIAGRVSRPIDLEAQFEAMHQKFEEASQLNDPIERDSRLRILESELTQLRAEAIQEEQDLAQAVFGLNAMLESMGVEYHSLLEPNAEESEILEISQAHLREAVARRQKANSKWFFKERAIQESEEAIKAAEQGVLQTMREVQRRARKRVLDAEIEQSLQEFMVRVEKTITVVQHRMTVLEEQIAVVAERKTKALEAKEEAASSLQELDRRLSEIEQTLQREEELLKVVEGSPSDSASTTRRVLELRADVERVRGERNGAFVVHQSKEKFATELSIHEKAQLKLLDNQRMWILSLQSDTEERVATFRARLEFIKNASDQSVDVSLEDLGSLARGPYIESVAKPGSDIIQRRIEKAERRFEHNAKVTEVAAAQAEAVQQIRLREAKAIEDFKRLYGIDPTTSSFFH